NYNDNTNEIIDMTADGVTTEGFSNSEAGEKTITIKYGGKQTTFKVTVVDKTLTSIEVSQMPTKTTYIRGYENLDLAGGKLKLKYNDNTSTEISMTANGVTVEGFSNSEAGEKIITVKYGGKQTTFKVTIVNDESKAEIVVTGIPDTVAINSCTITIKVTHPRNKITKITVNGNTVESNNGQASYKIKQNGEYTIVATDEYNTETTKQIEINNIYKLGDTTKNNKIELSDLIALIRHIAAKDSKATLKSWILPEDKQMLADVTQDGQLNLSDIIRYKRHLAASSDSNVARKNPNWILPSE
ncbi:MAG: bacterial Ig-like domain-containing protein, partial [Clostridia bacterium]|nr:bacterial Ig-like domain-containing protein [Clostridia bacterium]